MALLPGVFRSLRSLFRGKSVEREIDEELRGFLEESAAAKRCGGMNEQDALQAARIEMGSRNAVTHRIRSAGWESSLEILWNDLRYCMRSLLRAPGFTLVAVLSLALGIGANTAIFSVVESVVLAPLPYPESDKLVMVWESRPTTAKLDISIPDFQDWQHDAHSFAQMAAMEWADFDLTGPGAAEHLNGMSVTAGFFATLGVRPALGRDFTPVEDQRNAAPTVMISDRLWRERFGANPQTPGKSLLLDGTEFTIIGVLPANFRFYTEADVYTPLAHEVPLMFGDRTIHGFSAIARLRPGVTEGQARTELSAVQVHLDRMYPSEDRNLGVAIEPLKTTLVGDAHATLLLVFGAVGVVLLIACANVANLLLARSAQRLREFAVRAALGASRARLRRQLLTESVMLALAGGVLGLGLAKFAYSFIVAELPEGVPIAGGLNLHVLLFTLGVSLAVGVLFGLAPALNASKVDLQDGLKAGTRGATHAQNRGQSALVVVQVALTLVLLVGSGLLLRTIHNLWNVNPGFDPHHVIGFKVGLSPSITSNAETTRTALQQLIERVRQEPGIEAADLTNIVPLNGGDNGGPFWLGTQAPASPQDAPHALYFWTGPDYLKTMGISLLQGRYFTTNDTVHSEPVIVIDSTLAQKYFPGTNPIGRTITVAHWGPTRVIGVVGHVRHYGLDDSSTYNPGQIYISIYQLSNVLLPHLSNDMIILVRTPLHMDAALPEIKHAVYGLAADQPVYDVKTVEQVVAKSMSAQRFPMMLLAAFAGLGLLLACVGIYGVIAYSVSQRVREIGIRVALGAERRQILRMVLGQGMRMVGRGIALGVVTALGLTRALSSFAHLLYGVSGADPVTFIAISGVLVLVALLACWLPARRAAGVEPMNALRCE